MVKIERKIYVDSKLIVLWNQLTKALLRSLPLEQMNFINEYSFTATLLMKMIRITIPFSVKVVISDIREPDSLKCNVELSGLKGFIKIKQVAGFELQKSESDRTTILAQMETVDTSVFLEALLSLKIRAFMKETFDTMESLLNEWNA